MGDGPSAPTPTTITTSGGSPNYVPQGSASADAGLQGLQNLEAGSAFTLPQYLIPQYQSISNDIVNNPYAAGAQQGGVNAGAYAGNLANLQAGAAGNLFGMGNQAAPYGQQILQTGFDPQNALYDRTQQQIRDQTSATNAMSGLSGTPYGAGVQNQALSNFNIDWQNQQLQRQATAAQGYGALNNAVGADYTGGSGLGSAATGNYQNAGGIPYSTAQGISQGQLGGLGALASGVQGSFQPAQTLANDYQAYLGLGNQASGAFNSAQNSNFQNQLAAFNAQQAQNNSNLAGLGSLGSGLFGGQGVFSSGGALSSVGSGLNSGISSLGNSIFGGPSQAPFDFSSASGVGDLFGF